MGELEGAGWESWVGVESRLGGLGQAVIPEAEGGGSGVGGGSGGRRTSKLPSGAKSTAPPQPQTR